MAARGHISAGFSLVEMLIVVFLMTIVMSGMAIMQEAMLRDKGKILKDLVVHEQSDFARRRMIQVASDATQLMSPNTGAWSNELIGWTNLDTFLFLSPCLVTGCSPTTSNQNWKGLQEGPNNTWGCSVRWFRFCYNDVTKQLFYYSAPMNTGACSPPVGGNFNSLLVAFPPAGSCGGNTFGSVPVTDWLAGMGNVHVELLKDVPTADANPTWTGVFHRVRKNVVEVGYSVQLGTSETSKIRSEVFTGINILAPSL